jgi:hypothetical protein
MREFDRAEHTVTLRVLANTAVLACLTAGGNCVVSHTRLV